MSENHAIMGAISEGSYRRVQERPINLELHAGPSISKRSLRPGGRAVREWNGLPWEFLETLSGRLPID